MSETPLERAHRHLTAAADALAGVVGSGADQELLSVVTTVRGRHPPVGPGDRGCGGGVGAARVFHRAGLHVHRVGVERPGGVGAVRGPPPRGGRGAGRCAHQRGWHGVARRRLPATGEVFTAGKASLRHVEVVARVLGSRAAERLTPQQWAGVEQQLAAKTDQYSPYRVAPVGHRPGGDAGPGRRSNPTTGHRRGSTSCLSPATGRAVVGGSRGGSTTRRCSRRLPRCSTRRPSR